MSINGDSNTETAPLISSINDGTPQTPRTWHRCPWAKGTIVRVALLVTLICAIVFCLLFFRKQLAVFLGKTLPNFVHSLGPWGPIVYILLYAALTVACIPGSLLTIAAGVVFANEHLWSLFLAFGVVSVGSTLGAFLAFVLGSTVLKSWVQGKIVAQVPQFAATQAALAESGWRLTFLLRLAPVVPFVALNYALSVTPINILTYTSASWVGMIPGTFLYVYIGWASAQAATGRDATNAHVSHKTKIVEAVLIYGVGSVATLVVVIWATVVARKAVRKAIDKEQNRLDAEALVSPASLASPASPSVQ